MNVLLIVLALLFSGASGAPDGGGSLDPGDGIQAESQNSSWLLPTTSGAPLAPSAVSSAATLRGWATFYDAPTIHDAAAGPSLRAMLGSHWRGQSVTVCSGRCVRVTLTDWCACGPRHGQPTLIDLDDRAFAKLAPLGTGVIPVSISWSGPTPTLPPTDCAPEGC